MPPLPPAPHKGRRGTVINDTSRPLEPTVSRARFALRRGGFVSSSRVTVLSVLPDVSAEHTFEVIPKSMILPVQEWSFTPTKRSLTLKTVPTKYLQHKMFNFDIERKPSNKFPLMHTSNLWAYCLRILRHEGVVLLSFECLYDAKKKQGCKSDTVTSLAYHRNAPRVFSLPFFSLLQTPDHQGTLQCL